MKVSFGKFAGIAIMAAMSLQALALGNWQAGNGKTYTSFALAENNTSAGETIKYLGDDIEGEILDRTWSVSKDVVLDFNGKWITRLCETTATVRDFVIRNEGKGTLTLRNIILKQPRDKGKNKFANISLAEGKFVLDNAYVWGWGKGNDFLYLHSYDGASVKIVNSGTGMTFDGCNQYLCHLAKGGNCSLDITGGDFHDDPSAFVDKQNYEVVKIEGECLYRVQVKSVPTVKDEKGTIIVPEDGTVATLNPSDESVDEVVVSNLGDLTLAVSPQIRKITGVKSGRVVVLADEDTADGTRKVDITSAFTITDGQNGEVRIELNAEGAVSIDDGNGGTELITVKPVLSTKVGTRVEKVPFAVDDDGGVQMGVKAIPGLTYTMLEGVEVFWVTNSIGAQVARETRIVLQSVNKGERAEFFKIAVSR